MVNIIQVFSKIENLKKVLSREKDAKEDYDSLG